MLPWQKRQKFLNCCTKGPTDKKSLFFFDNLVDKCVFRSCKEIIFKCIIFLKEYNCTNVVVHDDSIAPIIKHALTVNIITQFFGTDTNSTLTESMINDSTPSQNMINY
jgi:hypothetical protein